MSQSVLLSSTFAGEISALTADRRLRETARNPRRRQAVPPTRAAALGSDKKASALRRKAKPKAEDGIFGTSSDLGLTKQNELFMGRLAMLGFAASLLGEAVTGKGIVAQLEMETGIPIIEAEPLLLFLIAFSAMAAVGGLGDRGTFVPEQWSPSNSNNVRAVLGQDDQGPLFGFTKANELFVGRLAQLGFAASLIGEILTGEGALSQLSIETGVPINELEPLVLFSIFFLIVAAFNPGTGRFASNERER